MILAILPYIQIALSVLLVAAILLQQTESSLGGAFGGGDTMGGTYHTRRGAEKFLFHSTIVLAILLALLSLTTLFLS